MILIFYIKINYLFNYYYDNYEYYHDHFFLLSLLFFSFLKLRMKLEKAVRSSLVDVSLRFSGRSAKRIGTGNPSSGGLPGEHWPTLDGKSEPKGHKLLPN